MGAQFEMEVINARRIITKMENFLVGCERDIVVVFEYEPVSRNCFHALSAVCIADEHANAVITVSV